MYENACFVRSIKAAPEARLAASLASHEPPSSAISGPRRELGTLSPKPIPGRPSRKEAALPAGLSPQLHAHSDATLAEHCQLWEAAHGMRVSTATMSRAMARLGWTRKKQTRVASERSEQARAVWREQVGQLDARTLVFVDETGSHLSLTPLYARAPKGERADGRVPFNRGTHTTLMASLSLQGPGEALLLKGAADGRAFQTSIEQFLVPSLQAGQIVVLDNLSTHQGERVRQAVEARGCRLLFLPASSPDLSPIEAAESSLKASLRKVGARIQERLQQAIAEALLTITTQDVLGWFRHCGYLPPEDQAEEQQAQSF